MEWQLGYDYGMECVHVRIYQSLESFGRYGFI